VPPFELRPGWLVRVYIPNFSQRTHEPLGRDLAAQLAGVLQFMAGPAASGADARPYARPYEYRLRDRFPWPLSAARYLQRQYQASAEQAGQILQELGLDERQPMSTLAFGLRLLLALKGLWLRHEAVLFDFYGLQADTTQRVEQALAQELARGKAAIAFDNLQFIEPQEPLLYTERVVVTEPGPGHWAFA
jgi:hypothetical protein